MGILGNISLGVVGNAITSAINGHITRQNATHNAMLERNNWQYMQSNAHQLEVQDLRNAGLNPVLSATSAHVASMPSVTGSSPSDGGVGASITSALANMEVEKVRKDLREKELDIQAKQLKLEELRNPSLIKNLDADTANKNANTQVAKANETYILNKSEYEKAESLARVANINQQTANSIILAQAQVANLRSGEVLNLANAHNATLMADNLVKDGLIKKVDYDKAMDDLQIKLQKNKLTGDFLNSWLGSLLFKAGLAKDASSTIKNFMPDVSFIK